MAIIRPYNDSLCFVDSKRQFWPNQVFDRFAEGILKNVYEKCIVVLCVHYKTFNLIFIFLS